MKKKMPTTQTVYEFICRHWFEYQRTPTVREIQKHFVISSTSLVDPILSILEREGKILRERDANQKRGASHNIRILKMLPKIETTNYKIQVRVHGIIGASVPKESVDPDASAFSSDESLIDIDLRKATKEKFFWVVYESKEGKE